MLLPVNQPAAMKDWIEQHHITEVECIVPDLAGAARGKIMPAAKFTGAGTLRMPQSIFMQSIRCNRRRKFWISCRFPLF